MSRFVVKRSPACVEFTVERSSRPSLWIGCLLSFVGFACILGWLPIVTLALVLVPMFVCSIQSESLRWLKDVGFVMEQRNLFGKRRQWLVEQESVEDILISEVVTNIDVHFYLIFVLEGENDFTVAFKNTTPPLKILQEVYREVMENRQTPGNQQRRCVA